MANNSENTVLNPNNMDIVERIKAPTSKFFKILRAIGLSLAAVGGTILAASIAIPAGLAAAAGYIALAGGVLTAVSQTAVDTSKKETTDNEND